MRKENAASHSPDQRTPVLKVGDRIPFLGTRPLAATLVLLAAACSRDSSGPVAIRLVDQFRPELVTGAPTRVNAPQHVAWNFGEPSGRGNAASSAAANLGWKAGHGISTDLMPTLLELSHLAGPEGMAGQSLVPLLAGAAGARAGADADEGNGDQAEFGIVHAAQSAGGWTSQPAFSERATFHPPEGEEAYSIVKDGWKLIHNTQGYTDRPEFELFERAKDPLDQTNVAEHHPDLVKQLTEELTVWRKSAEEQALPEADSTEGLSDDELRRLRSLGYIQ